MPPLSLASVVLEATAFHALEAAALLGGGILAGALLGAGIARLIDRRRPPAELPIRRAPSPASLGLDDDPIVAALVGGRDRTDASARRQLPGGDDR